MSTETVLELTEAEWRRVMEINANAVFWTSRAFGRHMIERQAGAVVNVGSMSGLIVNKGFAAAHYMVSKAAAHQVTKALAVEWAPFGVRVNAVAPGHTMTSQTEPLRSRSGLNKAAIFLVSEAASYCTGTVFTVDDGHTCW